MLKIQRSSQFKKDLKKIIKQRKVLGLLEDIITKLQHLETLPAKNRDHVLTSDWHGYRECHITPDWLLIYKVDKT